MYAFMSCNGKNKKIFSHIWGLHSRPPRYQLKTKAVIVSSSSIWVSILTWLHKMKMWDRTGEAGSLGDLCKNLYPTKDNLIFFSFVLNEIYFNGLTYIGIWPSCEFTYEFHGWVACLGSMHTSMEQALVLLLCLVQGMSFWCDSSFSLSNSSLCALGFWKQKPVGHMDYFCFLYTFLRWWTSQPGAWLTVQ